MISCSAYKAGERRIKVAHLDWWCVSSQVTVTHDGSLLCWRGWTPACQWELVDEFFILLVWMAFALPAKPSSSQSTNVFPFPFQIPSPIQLGRMSKQLHGAELPTGVKTQQLCMKMPENGLVTQQRQTRYASLEKAAFRHKWLPKIVFFHSYLFHLEAQLCLGDLEHLSLPSFQPLLLTQKKTKGGVTKPGLYSAGGSDKSAILPSENKNLL